MLRAHDLACRSCLNPSHWPISRKVAAGPIVLLGLLGLVVFFGWSIADRHQQLISQNYRDHAAYEASALRLPHLLARIQRDLYKLTIWIQINVEGPEVTSTLEAIKQNLADVDAMLVKLEGRHSLKRLREGLHRYSRGVEQALILIKRSPQVGATATRGMERIYLEADNAANELALSAETAFNQKLLETEESWKSVIVRFLLMIGAVGMLVPILALHSNQMIAKPIKGLALVVDRFRQGELQLDIPWTERMDEIGLVARAMESFRLNLIRNQSLESERKQLNLQLEQKVQERTRQLAEQKERLALALEKEHELNGLQRQFVSMVCHEFRTPLAVIDGNAQRIMKRHATMPPDRLEGALGKVRTSVTRLIELMESVLGASKLEAGAIELNTAPCDLADMITEVANNYREVNPTYRIKTDIDKLPESFIVDVKLIRQVVSNLVSNAVKYSPNGADIHIDAAYCEDGGVKIAVRDQGVGIPKRELERLFERFFRASTSTGIAGTGIGLHMVKALVDMHGGRVYVESEEGIGTTFIVYLPNRHDDMIAPDDIDEVA